MPVCKDVVLLLAPSRTWCDWLLCLSAGHGVGAALNVHEGPQSISTRYWITTPLEVSDTLQQEGSQFIV
jgi:Xaa-Pro aminopeptidase